jgi:arginine decarboxylase
LKKISIISKKMDHIPEDIQKLDEKLLDIYFCNFSVFQSLPDFWAIDQLFPVMPIHRLDECPTEKAIIVDLSCDSDGAINKFVHPRKTKSYLSLHKTKKEPYYLGIFLVGAYQEILGGLHNLFGDTNVVHVDVDANGILQFNQEIEGDTINEVLSYVQYNQADLIERFRHSIEKALKSKKIENKDSAILKKLYKTALETYTYLVV